MNDRSRLQILSDRLAELVAVMRLDTQSPWARKFERDLDLSRHLLVENHNRQDVIELSKSITDVYQGMGSFNDYSPGSFDASTGRYIQIPGTESFDKLAQEVFQAAVTLREI